MQGKRDNFGGGITVNMSSINELFQFPEPELAASISVEDQLEAWCNGISVHDVTTGRHCPDFSCCVPALGTDEETRIRFTQAVKDKRELLVGEFFKEFIVALCHHCDVDAQFVMLTPAHPSEFN